MTDTKAVLDCPMDESNPTGASNVRGYLQALLLMVWAEGEGFSGKRPFGESGWEYDLYIPLAKAGLVEGLVMDEDGYVAEFPKESQQAADQMVADAIRAMG